MFWPSTLVLLSRNFRWYINHFVMTCVTRYKNQALLSLARSPFGLAVCFAVLIASSGHRRGICHLQVTIRLLRKVPLASTGSLISALNCPLKSSGLLHTHESPHEEQAEFAHDFTKHEGTTVFSHHIASMPGMTDGDTMNPIECLVRQHIGRRPDHKIDGLTTRLTA